MVIDVKSYVKEEKNKLKDKYCRHLLIIQTGDDPASNSYIKGKIKDCEDVNFKCTLKRFPEGTNSMEIVGFIHNNMREFDGIIMQMPYYGTGDVNDIINAIPANKDVDGFRVDSPYIPCTPLGIYELMKHCGCAEGNLKTVIIGRGELVGKPMAKLLIEKTNHTVVVCNSHTPKEVLDAECKSADVIITAVGKNGILTFDMVKDGTYVFDAGIDFVDGHICGDCDSSVYARENVWATKTPGGIGLTTRLSLLRNTAGYNI